MSQTDRTKLTASNYDSHAAEYDSLSREAVPWLYYDKPAMAKYVVPLIGKETHVLDVGCGSGKVVEYLQTEGLKQGNIYGIDSSSELINIAKKVSPEGQFVVGDISLSEVYPNNSEFEVAISVRTFEYLSNEELSATSRNIRASLVSEGHFFVIVGHPIRVNNGDISTYLSRGDRKVMLPWGTYVNLYHKTVSDYVMTIVQSGFNLVSIDEPLPPEELKEKSPKDYEKYCADGASQLALLFKKRGR